MKLKILLGAVLVLLMVVPAYAGDCQSDILNFDAELAASTASEGAIKEAQAMRDQAAQACDAGNEGEAAAILENARMALNN